MYRTIVFLGFTVLLASAEVYGELQNVQVGGSVRIRGNWYTSPGVWDSSTARNPLFQGVLTNSFRGVPGGNPLAGLRYEAQPGRLEVRSPFFDWSESGADLRFVEERTKLNVRADFTDNVSAFIELDSYEVWGEDFRSNYITGVDSRAATSDDVEIYQAFIEASEMFGLPLRLRVGRQELKFGSGWLVAPNDTAAFFFGTSFDAIRATYGGDKYTVDAFWSKLADSSPLEEDGDVDFAGVYATCMPFEQIAFDAYWLWLRDGRALADTYNGTVGSWIEHLVGVDDYDVTNLHTFGLRGAGTVDKFDFDAEVAYQMGNADAVGFTFAAAAGPEGENSPYGPNGASWSTWGGTVTLGYTFDLPWSPRVYVNGVYFGGEDNRDIDFWGWLGAVLNPFWHAQPSVSFNRLFSSQENSEFIENTDLSNAWMAKIGIGTKPLENLSVGATLMHCEALDAYRHTWPRFSLLGQPFTLLRQFSFIDKKSSTDMGWEAEVIATYNYSADLSFEIGYAHLFAGDGLADGNFSNGNGLVFNGGTESDDADYVYWETKLQF